ncbi:glycosyltransferase family 2 protein [Pseudonocardia dioxanivorans]|uniref:glycosyltransferase family 2 protein n=1 Tax=Pseudonocardia dioxanivorans TaxID=240495 RepID=UPI000CD21ACB|nr:glycosyltransferase family 2 protein [Pseudonocardia dioxanivorans]
MYEGHRIAAVVPAFNEEKLIGKVITTMPDFVDHIVVVDDHSPDRTSEIAKATGDPRLTVIRHEANTGVGGAIVTGHRAALDLGADINVIMAGDAQMDPTYLPALLDPIVHDGYGFAKANRFFSTGSYHGMPKYRIFGNIVLSFLTKFASGYWHIFDPQNGYTATRRDVLQRMPLEQLAQRYSYENDVLINLNILRVPATDVPIPAVYGNEVSSIKLSRVGPEISNLLIRGLWRRFLWKYVVHSFSPVALFVIGGLFLTLFGTAVGIWTIVETLGPPVATAGSVILAVAPWLLGMQMLMYALMLDIQESPDRPTAPPSRQTRAGKRSVPPLPPLVEVDERHAAGNGAVTPAEVAEPDK